MAFLNQRGISGYGAQPRGTKTNVSFTAFSVLSGGNAPVSVRVTKPASAATTGRLIRTRSPRP